MTDLSSVMFYKAKFTITRLDEKELLWKLILHIREWQTVKWKRRGVQLNNDDRSWSHLKEGKGRIDSEENDNFIEVKINSDYFYHSENDEEYWACKIVEKVPSEKGLCPRDWTTEVGFERKSIDSAEFSCVLTYRDRPGVFKPCDDPTPPSLPNLIKMLIEDTSIRCHIGAENVIAHASLLTSGAGEAFWKKLISPERSMPYIYISPERDENESQRSSCLVHPYNLARAVCANAKVFFSESHDFSEEFKYYCGRDYLCQSGAIRVYRPNMDISNLEEDKFNHRYLTARDIFELRDMDGSKEYRNECSEEAIKILRRVLAQNVSFYDTLFRIDNCMALKREYIRSKRYAEIRSDRDKLRSSQNEVIDEGIERETQLLDAQSTISNLEEEIKAKDLKIDALEMQFYNVKDAARKNRELESALAARELIKTLPNEKFEIVCYFKNIFRDAIDFTDQCNKSLKDCKIPSTSLWRTFFLLATDMRRLFRNGSSNPCDEFKNITGIDVARGASSQTRKNADFMKQFDDYYDRRKIDIEAHITFTNIPGLAFEDGQSIHFCYDEVSEKVIIGWCGGHLKTDGTRRLRS
ncbi:MAG: hypothetical protein LBI19_02645 [Oscillospiraceae bacterium]|jgi:hypothetical protein|nr:hypothetical protein [Oscillospiraceae bacterium]